MEGKISLLNQMTVLKLGLLLLLDRSFDYFTFTHNSEMNQRSCSFFVVFFFFFYRSSSSPMNNRKLSVASPEKEDRYYTTRGSLGLDENGKVLGLDHHGHVGEERGSYVWPKLFLSLSSKEKEEDFMAMKGCKLPQRPKKRAKLLQKSLLVRFLIQM